MKNKLIKYLKEILIFIVIMSIFSNVVSLYRSIDLNKAHLPKTFHVEDASKPIMIHFWATWCPICKTEIDNIQRLSKYYQVITIVVKSGSDEDIKNYLHAHDLDFKVINDTDAHLAREFGVKTYPTTIIYDKDKNIVFSDVGYTTTFGLWLRLWWAS